LLLFVVFVCGCQIESMAFVSADWCKTDEHATMYFAERMVDANRGITWPYQMLEN
jgi:hypothetical protein